ncbi:hypothetical protein EGR_06053 [Echinococcus granulosus]|uniref:Uncharacterized protein n=1 Tax=Echinococcus granulosus TaxID=6210 RepID=W6UDZ1_ECHGR|nr:hypothetical protein EGR_06053 [Echinococcus granulosus]EUB59061.1 hypothetical protein EGR_06053 [Echinococcus granulosus]
MTDLSSRTVLLPLISVERYRNDVMASVLSSSTNNNNSPMQLGALPAPMHLCNRVAKFVCVCVGGCLQTDGACMRVRGCESMCCTVLTPQFRSAVATRPSKLGARPTESWQRFVVEHTETAALDVAYAGVLMESFQKVASGVRIILENEFGDQQELLGPSNEVDLKADTVSTSKRDRDGKKLRESVLASWLKTASDRRKKLQTLMDEYNELVIAVKRGHWGPLTWLEDHAADAESTVPPSMHIRAESHGWRGRDILVLAWSYASPCTRTDESFRVRRLLGLILALRDGGTLRRSTLLILWSFTAGMQI